MNRNRIQISLNEHNKRALEEQAHRLDKPLATLVSDIVRAVIRNELRYVNGKPYFDAEGRGKL